MVRLIELIIKGITKLLVFFGLWVPLCYIGLGIFLTVKYDFALLSLDFWSTLYLAGLAASLICALIITLRNIFVKPFHEKREKKKQLKQFKEIIREENLKEREFHLKRHREVTEKEEELARRERELTLLHKKLAQKKEKQEKRFRRQTENEIDFSYLDAKTAGAPAYPSPMPYPDTGEGARYFEQPAIYKSAIDPSLLIHEYNDRFVVYREEGGRIKLQKVEYK
ncbi:MAG: hypothetical protein ACOYIQ_04830 [Christensenellales bacterium]|jgi:hypothetical protein